MHDPDYVDFFRTAYDRWVEGTEYTHPAIPNYHKGRRISRVPNGIIGKLGYYATDTSCPVMRGTWDAIYSSAQCAVDAPRHLAAGEGPAYALCRLPGHHASRDASNGFCFFNNAAVAAQELRGTFAEVAILDMDTHAGNGTEDIFYDRSDVFNTSMHTDPSNYPPYFAGYDDERGEGSHLNVVLRPGNDEAQILMRANEMVTAIEIFGAGALVVSLGLDMRSDAPLSEDGMTAIGFAEMARRIAAMDLPTAYIKKGGYMGPSLIDNAQAFFRRRHLTIR